MSLKEKGNVCNALTRTNTLCTVMMYQTADIECVIYFRSAGSTSVCFRKCTCN